MTRDKLHNMGWVGEDSRVVHTHSKDAVSRVGWDEFFYIFKTLPWVLNVGHRFTGRMKTSFSS